VREAERARLLSGGEESEALIRVAFDSLGQKQCVLEPYRLSLSSMVTQPTPGYFLLMPWNMSYTYKIEENKIIE